MNHSMKTALAACAAAAALFALPAGAHAGTLSVFIGSDETKIFSSPSLICPYSTQYGSTDVGDNVAIQQGPEGSGVGVYTGSTNVLVACWR